MSDDFEARHAMAAPPVGGIVLAAGLSSRMGRFKLTLPWDDTTIIARVVQRLAQAGLLDVVVVTGHRAGDVVEALAGLRVRSVLNSDYRSGQMLSSVQVGLQAMTAGTRAALLCLGDQPQIEVKTVRAVLSAGRLTRWERIIIPSYRQRAGHPILLPSGLWPAIRDGSGTLRDVLSAVEGGAQYLEVDTATVLADIDTPGDYERSER